MAVARQVAVEAGATALGSRGHRGEQVAVLVGQPAGQHLDLALEARVARPARDAAADDRSASADWRWPRLDRAADGVAGQRLRPRATEQRDQVAVGRGARPGSIGEALVPAQCHVGPSAGQQLLLGLVEPVGGLAVQAGREEVLELAGEVAVRAQPGGRPRVELRGGRLREGQGPQPLGEQRMAQVAQAALVARAWAPAAPGRGGGRAAGAWTRHRCRGARRRPGRGAARRGRPC